MHLVSCTNDTICFFMAGFVFSLLFLSLLFCFLGGGVAIDVVVVLIIHLKERTHTHTHELHIYVTYVNFIVYKWDSFTFRDICVDLFWSGFFGGFFVWGFVLVVFDVCFFHPIVPTINI